MPGATFELPTAYVAFGVVNNDGAMALGSDLLNSAAADFEPFDVGKRITVEGAGPAGVPLETEIVGFIGGTQVRLKEAAATAVAGSDISYVQGVYRLSDLLAQGDIDGNVYQVLYTRHLSLQLISAAGVVFVGGRNVSPTNHGFELEQKGVLAFSPGTTPLAITTGDYLTSVTPGQQINVYWADDMNIGG